LDANELELVFVPDSSLHDGRFANNAWLQELPESLTKLTWDNAALVAPATAERLGLQQGGMVRLEHDGRALELPVYVMPGQAAGSIGVWLGYGRRDAGPVGSGVGFDAYTLRTTAAMHWAAVKVASAPGRHTLATTQNHYAMDPLGAGETAERAADLAREMSLEQYVEQAHHPDEHHGPHEAPLWKRWEYDGHKWGMAIDLNACTGCNSCLIACQSENNIPVVGKDEVVNGRDMHWIRVDRYFAGEPDDPAVAHQPLTCHHCENAPCEQVCPVAATVHDSEGLNVMVYNRCVGTRYCANNCPYKVRRFNYFNNHKNESDLEKMVFNPEVTVRSRGVMEKCSFCVQRISGAKIRAKIDGREIRDGDVTPACAQACPTRAIHFGDLNDETSDVRKQHEDLRAYGLLEELDVRPRTRYLTRLRNRHASGASESVE
jgi:molybdopterin-containing oxidoreductase family iron-sulfur binding subunit